VEIHAKRRPVDQIRQIQPASLEDSLKTPSRHSKEAFDAPRRYTEGTRSMILLYKFERLVVALGLSLRKFCDRYKLYKASRQVIGTQIQTYAAKSCFQELCCVAVVLS
jgi:hypothetical protein